MINLSGFTLFKTGPNRWQLSTREVGEVGWEVNVGYPDDKAQEILELVGKLLPNKPSPLPAPAVQDGKLNLRPRRQRAIL